MKQKDLIHKVGRKMYLLMEFRDVDGELERYIQSKGGLRTKYKCKTGGWSAGFEIITYLVPIDKVKEIQNYWMKWYYG